MNLSSSQVSDVSPAGCSMSNKVQSTWIGNARKTEAMQRLYARSRTMLKALRCSISKNKSFLTKKEENHEQKRDNSTTF